MGAGIKHRMLGFRAHSWSVSGVWRGKGGLLNNCAWVRTGVEVSPEVRRGGGVDSLVSWRYTTR